MCIILLYYAFNLQLHCLHKMFIKIVFILRYTVFRRYFYLIILLIFKIGHMRYMNTVIIGFNCIFDTNLLCCMEDFIMQFWYLHVHLYIDKIIRNESFSQNTARTLPYLKAIIKMSFQFMFIKGNMANCDKQSHIDYHFSCFNMPVMFHITYITNIIIQYILGSQEQNFINTSYGQDTYMYILCTLYKWNCICIENSFYKGIFLYFYIVLATVSRSVCWLICWSVCRSVGL